MALILSTGLLASACAVPPPYEAEPASVYQWQRQQDEIRRREDERVRLCAMMNKDSDRFKRDCARPGDPR